MNTRIAVAGLAILLTAASAAPADIGARIRAEEQAHSQIMRTVHFLADVYGPRLTGTPNEKEAAQWAIAQMRQWGLKDAHLDAWDFGHPGWENVHAQGRIVSPAHDSLTFKVAAWTPGTNGAVTAPVVVIDPPVKIAGKALAGYLGSVRAKVRGKIVMVGKYRPIEPDDVPAVLDEKYIERALDPSKIHDRPPDPKLLTSLGRQEQIDAFLRAAGALVRIDDGGVARGVIRASANYTYDISKSPPIVVLTHEDYGRLWRLLADHAPVVLSFEIANRRLPAGQRSYSAIAEIPGTDKADEIVMLGAHLDSWQFATGATDDGIGCAVMMEAVRILEAFRVHPRRTIRIALWGGEEEKFNGSQDYVARHFGTAENPRPEFKKLDAYLNIDAGTGRIRAANVFGPPEAAHMLSAALKPYADLGFLGVVNHGIRRIHATDATVFSRAGLPAVGFMQDPADYPITLHTNFDTYDSIVEKDVEQQAIVIAALAYNLATRKEIVPRFDKAHMPKAAGPAPRRSPIP